MGDSLTQLLEFPDNHLAQALFGECDAHLKLIEQRLGVTIHPRGNTLAITAESAPLEKTCRLLKDLYAFLEAGHPLDSQQVEEGTRLLADKGADDIAPLIDDDAVVHTRRRRIQPRTARQAEYIHALRTAELCFAVGPAGSGKTYLAVAMAVAELLQGRVTRIILTRPAVEAGEHLGFLPGGLQDKVDPYLRPLYDALYDTLGFDRVERMMAHGTLEIAPLAYMRGRTLNDAFIILDEAQNTTPSQMKMFLTRFGAGSKVVVAGDVTQVDLPPGRRSGMDHAMKILARTEGIRFIHFTERDVVRHPLVRAIVRAYDAYERQS